jgi:SNF2 family DNA or RNA helicase
VANYEQVFRDLDLMKRWSPDLVVLDEAQRIKNWATQTAGRVKQLDVPYRLVLTGTPMENRLDELSSIMDWVDPCVMAPKWRLGPAHTITADGDREVVGVRRLDVLRTRLAPRMLRRRRAEILEDLPERTDTVLSVAMTEAQQDAHDELSPAIARLASAGRRRPLTQGEFLRLMSLLTTQRVIANGLAQLRFESVWPGLRDRPADAATIQTLSMPKLAHLRDLVESVVVDQGRKVVVFSQWRRALSLARWAIGDLLDAAGVRAAFFTGGESQRRRTRNIVDFHDEADLRVLLCTDAGGVGLNLQRAASACVHLEMPWNPAVFEQRVARLHRLGQPDPVDVYTLLSEGSIEARIAGAVANKRAMFTGLFDGDTDTVSFEGAAGFLAAVQAVAEPVGSTTVPEDEDPDEDPDNDDGDGDHVEELVAASDEVVDEPAARQPALAAPDLPDAAQVREMFAELHVVPKPDGGLQLDASPRAAKTLGALFAGMASLLGNATTSRPEDP